MSLELEQLAEKLTRFATAFTGRTVLILAQTTELSKTEATKDLALFLPHKPPKVRENLVTLTEEEEMRLGKAYYFGLTALQASAFKYGTHTVLPNLRKRTIAYLKKKNLEIVGVKEEGEEEPISIFEETSLGPFCKNAYNLVELIRRTRILRNQYPFLMKDFGEAVRNARNAYGFEQLFGEPDVLVSGTKSLITLLFKEYGVEPEKIEQEFLLSLKKRGRESAVSYDFQEMIQDALSDFGRGVHTEEAYWKTWAVIARIDEAYRAIAKEKQNYSLSIFASMDTRGIQQEELLQNHSVIYREAINNLKKEKEAIEKEITVAEKHCSEQKRLLLKAEVEKKVTDTYKQRLEKQLTKVTELLASKKQELLQTENKIKYSEKEETKEFEKQVARIAHFDSLQIIAGRWQLASQNTIPEAELQHTAVIRRALFTANVLSCSEETYFPEKRFGRLVKDFVTVRELRLDETSAHTCATVTDQERSLERKAAELQGKINKKKELSHNVKWDIISPQEIRTEIHCLEKELDKVNDSLKDLGSKKAFIMKRHFLYDARVLSLIEEEMEQIRPRSRTKVRNQEAGELDVKKYYDFFQSHGSSSEKFYWQWKRKQRDVATLILVDCSRSSELMAGPNHSVLDCAKKAGLHVVTAIKALGDKHVLAFYAGESQSDVRVYVLSTTEVSGNLPSLLTKISGAHNNRDGAAIRWATRTLEEMPAKTKYLFHIGDFDPKDVTVPKLIPPPPGADAPYERELALEDTIDAYNSARARDIIPYGFCIAPKKPEPLSGRLRLANLKKVARPKMPFEDVLRQKFKGYYAVVRNLEELPDLLRKVYLELSFEN